MKIKRLLICVLSVFVLDQFTKWLVLVYIPLGHNIPVIPNFFDLIHVTNKGAAFGFLANLPESYRFLTLLAISLLAVILILVYYWKLPPDRVGMQIPLALIIGGAAGNIFDRIFRGSVVDFLSFHWYDKWADFELFGRHWQFRWEWPAFNVADSAISISVVWLLIALARMPASEEA